MKRYLIIIEKEGKSYGAYSPDVPGCIAVGQTRREVQARMREAIQFHLEGLAAEGLPIPEATTAAAYVAVE